jgi:hypothetical protein
LIINYFLSFFIYVLFVYLFIYLFIILYYSLFSIDYSFLMIYDLFFMFYYLLSFLYSLLCIIFYMIYSLLSSLLLWFGWFGRFRWFFNGVLRQLKSSAEDLDPGPRESKRHTRSLSLRLRSDALLSLRPWKLEIGGSIGRWEERTADQTWSTVLSQWNNIFKPYHILNATSQRQNPFRAGYRWI